MQLIKHVHIFAPQDLGIQDILISEGHIAHIAPHIETAPYMEITDGSGKQLTPGLIDRHVHVRRGRRRICDKDAGNPVIRSHTGRYHHGGWFTWD